MKTVADSIREYRPDDLREVEECLAQLQDFSKHIYPKAAAGTIAPRYLQHLMTRCNETSGKIFVAESEARVIGMVCVFARVKSREVDEEEYEYAYVSDLVILADHRSRGLGRALLKRAEDHAKSQGAKLLRINVLAQNEVARNLYLECGFGELVMSLQKSL
jgi:GNAT superfamily N-acetyltransferase